MNQRLGRKKICEWCGKEFLSYSGAGRCCSPDCAKKAYKERKKKEAVAIADHVARRTKRERARADLQEQLYVKVADAARLLGVHRQTIYRYLIKGILHGRRFSSRLFLIRKADIEPLFDMVDPYEMVKREHKPINEWYTFDEVTARYGIQRARIGVIIRKEGIPTKKEGKRAYIAKKRLDSYFKKREDGGRMSDVSDLDMSQWWTREEIADAYGLTVASVSVMTSTRHVLRVKKGGKTYYNMEQIRLIKGDKG